jgi:hypothetical protein
MYILGVNLIHIFVIVGILYVVSFYVLNMYFSKFSCIIDFK